MRLRVLGSSGGYPGPGRPSSGFFLEHEEAKLWIDAGNGTFGELQRAVDFTRVDTLLLSHIHADHCADVYPLHVAIRYGVGGGFKLPLYAPPGSAERLGGLLNPGGADQLAEAFDFHTVDAGDQIEVAGVRFTFLRTAHPIHCLAIRAARGGELAMLKWISSFPGNVKRALPSVMGMVCVSDAGMPSISCSARPRTRIAIWGRRST